MHHKGGVLYVIIIVWIGAIVVITAQNIDIAVVFNTCMRMPFLCKRCCIIPVANFWSDNGFSTLITSPTLTVTSSETALAPVDVYTEAFRIWSPSASPVVSQMCSKGADVSEAIFVPSR